MRGVKEVLFQYGGAGPSLDHRKNDRYYKFSDILGSNNGDYNTHYWTFLGGQFNRYIINKVTVYLSNFNISTRMQQDAKNALDFGDFVIGEHTNYPFANGNFYEYNNDSGAEGYYVKIIRSVNQTTDANTLLSDAVLSRHVVIYPVSSKHRGKRSAKYVYYPRCKKPLEVNETNLPFKTKTINDILTLMDPKHDNYFRLLIGFGQYIPLVNEKINIEAYEVMIRFNVTVMCDLKFLYGVPHDYTN